MELPSESTRSIFFDLIPTPWTLAVMIDPPLDPEFGVISINLAVRLILEISFSLPSGDPTPKYIFELLNDPSVMLTTDTVRLVELTGVTVYETPPIWKSGVPLKSLPVTVSSQLPFVASKALVKVVTFGTAEVKV
jgi:hypothetical protein